MKARLDQANLAFPLAWAGATCLIFALAEWLRTIDTALADLGGDDE